MKTPIFCTSALGSAVLFLAGCGGSFQAATSAGNAAKAIVQGKVMGGQQAIIGARVYLYAVSPTNGGTATSLIGGLGYVPTLNDGSFTLSPGSVKDYSCTSGQYVYLLALGGSPGLANGVNSKIALASGLGACSSLTTSTTLTIDEVTTAAMAYAFASYATTETQIGTSTNLSVPFSTIASLTNLTTGGAAAGTASSENQLQKLNSLGNVIAACVNSTGTGTGCTTLMTNANVTGANGTPIDTFQAALNIEQNPTRNVPALYMLQTATSPFAPALSTAPSDWSLTPIGVGACIVPDANTYTFHTSLGNIPVELRPDVAPVNVANFLSYVNSGAYTNSIIHRVQSGFINQGGGYTTDVTAKIYAIPQNAPVANEFHLSNVRGTLAMALSGSNINSATNQFFFNTADNSSYIDSQSDTVIGQVVQIQQAVNGTLMCTGPTGLAVMDAINATQTYNFSQSVGAAFNELPLVNYTQGTAVQESNFVLINSVGTAQ
jgi:cyclophilin family peptidyl-prolyl cis-trans isomerase